MQHEGIENLHKLGKLILFQADEALQRWRLLPGTAHAMNHVTLLLLANEENVEHLDLSIE